MIPVRDDNPNFLTPYATLGLIGINTAIWILLQGMGGEPELSNSVCTLGAVPGELFQAVPPGTTFQLSSKTLCFTGPDPVWHTILTSSFLHGSWPHLIGNMWFLWVFGNRVEDAMGPLRFTSFYLLCGLIAVTCQIASSPQSLAPIVGASGAIGGVVGAYIVLYPRVHVHMRVVLGLSLATVAVPGLWMLGYWLLLQAIATIGAVTGQEGIAHWEHLGGFLAGVLLAPLLSSSALLTRHPYYGWARREQPNQSWHRIE